MVEIGIHHQTVKLKLDLWPVFSIQTLGKSLMNNIEYVYGGSFNGALLEDNSCQHAQSAAFKMVALKYAFCDKEQETKELQG